MSGIRLPQGWVYSTISKAISNNGLISDGDWIESKDQDPNGSVRLIQLADIGDGIFRNKSERYMTPDKALQLKCTYLLSGDVLVARMPDPLGRACIFPGVGKKAVTVVDVCLFRTSETSAVKNTLLKYWLNNPVLRNLISENASGTTRKRITRKKLEQLEIPLPPLSEQKIIAEKLDTLLAQVDSTKARLEKIPQILKRFRQAVLAAAVGGKLSNRDNQWKKEHLKNLCISISDGDHQAPPKSESGVPFLVISDINKGYIDFDKVSRWVPDSYYNDLKEIRRPSINDILYTVTGSFGIPVIVDTDEPFCFQRHIAIIKPNKNIISYKYLAFYLASPQTFKHACDVATGTAQKTVSLSSLRNFEILVPSLKEQTEIVRRVEQLFAYADTIEKQVNAALERVNNLTQSILAKAFRGELTAQWRAENPDLITGENSAAALLEKIKAERATSGTKKTARKKS